MAYNIALKTAIIQSGKRQTVVAARAGLSDARLSRVINGHEEPTKDEKRAIAKALRRSQRELFPAPVVAVAS